MERGHDMLTRKLTGIVDAVELDDDNGVLAVQIVTLDEEDYLVGEGARGEYLLELVGELVEVEGTVRENEDGDQVITVRKYLVLDKEWDA